MTDTPLPEWLESMVSELGLDDTPQTAVGTAMTSLLDVVKNIEFTPQGWAHVKQMIVNDKAASKIPLFQRITEADSDDLLLFTVMIAIPYGLAKALGYEGKNAEKLINYFTASYVIAMSRGYELGAKDSRAERRTQDE